MIAIMISVVCLCTQAFFSSSEIAIVSSDRARMRQLALLGQRGAQLVEWFLQHPHRLLSITLLGTQLSVVTSTVVMTLWLHQRVPQRAELYLLLCFIPAIIVFGEIVPKALVRRHANEWSPAMARLLHWSSRLFFFLTPLLSKLSEAVARKLGIDAQRKLVSRQELEQLVSPSTSPVRPQSPSSDVTEGERSMIARILDLSDVTVDQLMVPLSGIVALPEESTLEDIVREITENKYSRIPIYRDRLDQIVGVVHAFDVLTPNDPSLSIAHVMRPPLYVPESHKAIELLAQMRDGDHNLAIVVDEYGGAVGIVTQEDILEEVLGEIEDEYDEHPPSIVQESDGSYRVSGSTAVTTLNQQLKLQIPESEEYESLAGFLLEHMKRIPRTGDTLRLGTLVFVVHAADERRIESVRITHQAEQT